MHDVLGVDSAEFAESYSGSRKAARCISEALTPEVMKHRLAPENGHYRKPDLFPVSSDNLAVFLVVEISETATVDPASAFFAGFTCVVDAAIDAKVKKTHDMAAAIDSLIMDGKAVTIANQEGGVVQVAPHVLTLVVSDVPEVILSAEYASALYTTIAGIIRAARASVSDNKQG
jgi:hypothetical protein